MDANKEAQPYPQYGLIRRTFQIIIYQPNYHTEPADPSLSLPCVHSFILGLIGCVKEGGPDKRNSSEGSYSIFTLFSYLGYMADTCITNTFSCIQKITNFVLYNFESFNLPGDEQLPPPTPPKAIVCLDLSYLFCLQKQLCKCHKLRILFRGFGLQLHNH